MRLFAIGTVLFWLVLAASHARAQGAGPPAPPPDDPGSPDEDAASEESSLQVLVIPISGTVPSALGSSAQLFTDTLLALTRSTGSRPVEARVGKAEIIAITGCSAESRECFDAVADTVEVDQLVFGTIEPAADDDGTAVVTLTLVKPEERSYETRRVVLVSTSPDDANAEFEYKARAFLGGEPEPTWPSEPPEPVAVEPPPPGRSLDLGRVEPYSWAVAGGGLAVTITGIALLAAASGKQAEVDDAPTNTVEDLDNLAALERSGQRFNTWGNGAVIAGGVITAIGIGLIVKQGYLDSGRETRDAITITPALENGGGVTITWGGAF